MELHVGGKDDSGEQRRVSRIEVTLLGTEVRRTIEADATTTLGELHDVVQAAVGWADEHLHMWSPSRSAWQVWAPAWYQERFEDRDDADDEDDVRVAAFGGRKLTYVYDLGDSWHHELRVRAARPARDGTEYPRIVAAHGTCPPEDCGGAWSFARYTADELAEQWGFEEWDDAEELEAARARLACTMQDAAGAEQVHAAGD